MRLKGIDRNDAFILSLFFAIGFLAFFLISTNVSAELAIVKNESLFPADNINKTITNTTMGNNTSNKPSISQESFPLSNQNKMKEKSLEPNNISKTLNTITKPKEIDTATIKHPTSKLDLNNEPKNSKIEIPIVSYIENEGQPLTQTSQSNIHLKNQQILTIYDFKQINFLSAFSPQKTPRRQ